MIRRLNMAILDDDFAFMDGIEKITGVLNGVADRLDDLAESLGASEEELKEEIEEENAGKTEEEIAQEDAMAAAIAAPIVNALDGLSDMLYGATAQVCEMTAELFSACKEKDI
jgi:hypothetical protein